MRQRQSTPQRGTNFSQNGNIYPLHILRDKWRSAAKQDIRQTTLTNIMNLNNICDGKIIIDFVG
jgi:hypothetical protein